MPPKVLIGVNLVQLAQPFDRDTRSSVVVVVVSYSAGRRSSLSSLVTVPCAKTLLCRYYPSQMIKFGPLIHAWTMGQEAKLSFIKRVSRAGNYKNVSKTVTQRHQF